MRRWVPIGRPDPSARPSAPSCTPLPLQREVPRLLTPRLRTPRLRSSRAHNRKAAINGWLTFICSLLAPLLVITLFLHRSGIVAEVASSAAVPPTMVSAFSQTCDALVAPEQQLDEEGASSSSGAAGLLSMQQFLVGTLVLFVALQAISKSLRRYKPSYSKREFANLVATQRYVTVRLSGQVLHISCRSQQDGWAARIATSHARACVSVSLRARA